MNPTSEPSENQPPVRSMPRGFRYIPAIGPALKGLLAVVFAGVALLAASGFYLLAIRVLEAQTRQVLTNAFTFWIYLAHIGVGLVFGVPFVWFGVHHWITSRSRPNRVAVRLGIWVFMLGLATLLSGGALLQIDARLQLPTGTAGRWMVYALHLLAPLAAVGVYVMHRRAGPAIRWRWGAVLGLATVAFTAIMAGLHFQDLRQWNAEGPREGERYFYPSEARTASGNFIPAQSLMADEYCLRCHQDVYKGWFHSSHHFSSFNNPPYLFSVRETRKVALARDGDVRAARWCAGCHDPVPFFSGAFDDPKFDDVDHPTAHAGITCTACHAITHVNSTMGNAAYTIEEPLHYPFALSGNAMLQWINNQLVKAKPDFHKKTFLKPLHKTAEFCSTCHKVSLPLALNHYQEFTRGQNHYDGFLLSGVSGHGARSFYYPEKAKENCAACHMPLTPSNDFGARDFDGSGVRKVHDHLFVGANTGLPEVLKREPRYADQAPAFQKNIETHAQHLRDKKLRVDLFALKDGGTIDGKLLGPLRPNLPALEAGRDYLVEVVVRTLAIGHPFSQGTVDSNEIWVEFTAGSGGKVFASNGLTRDAGDTGPVDERAHFINVLMLDRDGNRIDRRNPQDIFTPLYDKQIPPGGAAVVHYRVRIPADATGPIDLSARVRYRKFDQKYMEYVYKGQEIPKLPVVDICSDKVTLPLKGQTSPVAEQKSPIEPAWQRWNDYGIGCLLEGGAVAKRGELRQAEDAFGAVAALGGPATAHGYLNRARVYVADGRLDLAAADLERARTADPPAPWWTLSWFTGLVAQENATDAAGFDRAIAAFRAIVDPANQPRERGFDFSRDYVVWNQLGKTLYQRAQVESNSATRNQFLAESGNAYLRALAEDSEDLDAHYGISQALADLAGTWIQPPVPPDDGCATAEELIRMADTVIGKGDPDTRLAEARLLARALADWTRQVSKPTEPRLPPLRRVLSRIDAAWSSETNPALREAMAGLMVQGHRLAHTLYKPDDLARARTTTAFRAKHPAANAAAEAIVLYPTAGTPSWNKP